METIIQPSKSWRKNFEDLWQYRDLFITFAWRDIKVRYKQTFVGAAWAMIQPFLMMVVFTIFFSRIADIGTHGIPYPIFSYTGLLFWNLFSNSLSASSASLVRHQSIIQKVYFPRIIMPIATTLVNFVDFLIASIILIGLMAYYSFTPTAVGILLLLPALVITALSFVGLGLILSSVNVKFRDVRYALPFFIQLMLFVTPVIYPSSVLGKYAWIWYFNPMAGVIETMRAGLLGVGSIDWMLLGSSALVSIVVFVIGVWYFTRTQKYFADIV